MTSDILAGLLMVLYATLEVVELLLVFAPLCSLLLPVSVFIVSAVMVLSRVVLRVGDGADASLVLETVITSFLGVQLALASRILLSGAIICLIATLPWASALAPLE